MLALFRSVELELFQRVGVSLPNPTLDLGCGDGRLMQMLREMNFIKDAPVGLDFSWDGLLEGQARAAQHRTVRGDAGQLPFAEESFASVVCNNVFSSMPNFSIQALEEVRRVLQPGGLVVATVATTGFMEMLPVPRFLESISRPLAKRYLRKAKERLPHFHTLSLDEWRHRFVQSGLEVIRAEPYFSSQVGAIWNMLFFQAFRIFGLLRFVPLAESLFAPVLERVLERFVIRERDLASTAGQKFGYALIIARRAHLGPGNT